MKSQLNGIDVFLTIAREGSFSGAARALGVGVPAVSHRLKALEQDMGVELISRTTRSLELTRAGAVLQAGAEPAIAGLRATIETARSAGQAKSGTLRLTIPWSAYKVIIAPVLTEFQTAYPDIRLDMSFDEGLVDIVRHGFHAGFRLGDRLSDGMIATRLTRPLMPAYTATPGYLADNGTPHHPRDLMAHKSIRYRFVSANRLADWQFDVDGQLTRLDPPAALVFDTFRAVVDAIKQGHGIGWSLRAVVAEEIADGRLVSLLEPYRRTHPPFYIFYPEQHRRLELLRLFVDFLTKRRG